jgi:hypothetical protein
MSILVEGLNKFVCSTAAPSGDDGFEKGDEFAVFVTSVSELNLWHKIGGVWTSYQDTPVRKSISYQWPDGADRMYIQGRDAEAVAYAVPRMLDDGALIDGETPDGLVQMFRHGTQEIAVIESLRTAGSDPIVLGFAAKFVQILEEDEHAAPVEDPENPPATIVSMTAAMVDAYGDGWDDTTLRVYDSGGALVWTLELDAGESAAAGAGIAHEEYLDLAPGDYVYQFGGGSGDWLEEASFSIINSLQGEILVEVSSITAWSGAGDAPLDYVSGNFTISGAPAHLVDSVHCVYKMKEDYTVAIVSDVGNESVTVTPPARADGRGIIIRTFDAQLLSNEMAAIVASNPNLTPEHTLDDLVLSFALDGTDAALLPWANPVFLAGDNDNPARMDTTAGGLFLPSDGALRDAIALTGEVTFSYFIKLNTDPWEGSPNPNLTGAYNWLGAMQGMAVDFSQGAYRAGLSHRWTNDHPSHGDYLETYSGDQGPSVGASYASDYDLLGYKMKFGSQGLPSGWHHVCVVRSATASRLYIDGQLAIDGYTASSSFDTYRNKMLEWAEKTAGNVYDNDKPVSFGGYTYYGYEPAFTDHGGGRKLPAEMALFHLYNRALSQIEVLMDAGWDLEAAQALLAGTYGS